MKPCRYCACDYENMKYCLSSAMVGMCLRFFLKRLIFKEIAGLDCGLRTRRNRCTEREK